MTSLYISKYSNHNKEIYKIPVYSFTMHLTSLTAIKKK